MAKKFVSWRRVSTFKQNRSGLGLEAQKEIIKYFIERDKGEWIADYSECYTGKELSGCVELRKAMERAKKENAVLVIAKSDRFRNCQEALGILTEMGEGNIEFCDLPHSDRFTLTLFWALAEREALITSIRTKQALAVKKTQGYNLGASNEKYRLNYMLKSDEQKEKEIAKRAETKRKRFQDSKETQVMFRILRRVFPDATKGEPSDWAWGKIGTKGKNKDKIFQSMIDYQEMDETGTLFKRWDFKADERTRQQKLSAYLITLRKSVKNVG